MIRRRPDRRGYALMLVMVFVVLFSAVIGLAWRRVNSALRVEHAREVRSQCDKGSVQAMASAVQVLETRLKMGADSIARLDGSDAATISYKKIVDSQWYSVVYTRENTAGTDWAISVTVVAVEPSHALLPSSPP